jgi:CRP-like cAMP-binding protein
MISPEVLRRFPFFGWIEAEDLRAIAMISEEVPIEKDTTIFEECASADSLYFLISGSVDLFFSVREETRPDEQKEYFSGSINPGEAFAISALIEPHVYAAAARASAPSDALRLDAIALRRLLENKPLMG